MTSHNLYVYLDIAAAPGDLPRRVVIELFVTDVPKTCENFFKLCTGECGIDKWYKNSFFHRIVKGSYIQAGDITRRNGTGGESIFGGVFEDENFAVSHDRAGRVSMASNGPNTNNSQFLITLKPMPHLDGKNVCFGQVVSGIDVIELISQTPTDEQCTPLTLVVIKNCGEVIHVPKPQGSARKRGKPNLKTVKTEEELLLEVQETVSSSVSEGLKAEKNSINPTKIERARKRLKALEEDLNFDFDF